MIQIQIEVIHDCKEDKEIRLTGVLSGRNGIENILIAIPYDSATQLLDALHFAGTKKVFPQQFKIEVTEDEIEVKDDK